MARTEAQPVLLLAERLAEDGDLGAHRGRDLHRHVAETAHADDRHPRPLTGVPVLQRRVGGDPGAEQRRGELQLELVGDAHDEPLGDDDPVAVAAIGGLSVIPAPVVGFDRPPHAEHLLAGQAVLALAARVDHAAHTDPVAPTGRHREPATSAPTPATTPAISCPGTIG